MEPARDRDDRLPKSCFPGRFSLSEHRAELFTNTVKPLMIVGDYEWMSPLQASVLTQ